MNYRTFSSSFVRHDVRCVCVFNGDRTMLSPILIFIAIFYYKSLSTTHTVYCTHRYCTNVYVLCMCVHKIWQDTDSGATAAFARRKSTKKSKYKNLTRASLLVCCCFYCGDFLAFSNTNTRIPSQIDFDRRTLLSCALRRCTWMWWKCISEHFSSALRFFVFVFIFRMEWNTCVKCSINVSDICSMEWNTLSAYFYGSI